MLMLALVLAAPASAQKDDQAEGEHDDHHHALESHEHHDHHDEHIARVEPEVLQEFGVTLGKVGPGVLREEIILPGEIQFNREAVAYATPRYNGVVTTIEARLAEDVKKGQVLVKLESVDTLRPFDVKAPINGSIVDFEVAPGQTVEAGQALFTIADLRTVWADLRIYQRDIGKIRAGQSVVINGGRGVARTEAKIAYIAPTVDEHTRTGLARVVLKNPNRDWKPGQFIKGRVSIGEHHAGLLVPRTAVLTHEDETVVFVQTEEGFEPRPIQLGHSDAEYFEVVSGLSAGEIIATRNPISLKAELGKASFGGHEGHAH